MNNLTWGGCDAVSLARRFGTPLYVLDENIIRARCREVRETFLDKWENTGAFYASKAFLTMGMARIVGSEGLGLDLVSGGEVYAARRAGFDMGRTLLHGSAKSDEEIEDALKCGVGRLVIDNMSEISQTAEIAERLGVRARVLIRAATGVEPDTHKAVQTAGIGGKFGISLTGDNMERAVRLALSFPQIDLYGFHFHLGSMIFDPSCHAESVGIMTEEMRSLRDALGFETRELDAGGGFGVSFAPGEKGTEIASFTDRIMERLTADCGRYGLPRPAVYIEPGRWIVSEAGITLYTVESVKETGAERAWINVDGGMYDNPRPCLYGAKYSAVIAGRAGERAAREFAVAGHCCESGDTLIESIALPEPRRGDIIALFSTGAYTFSMASNYNLMRRPALALVKDGRAELMVRRQSYDDLLSCEVRGACETRGAREQNGVS